MTPPDAASEGDTVIVADGVYTGNGNRDIDFLGKAITLRSQSGPENCIIDCNREWYRGFRFINDEGPNSVLDGFTITNGLCSNKKDGCLLQQPSRKAILKSASIIKNPGRTHRRPIFIQDKHNSLRPTAIFYK